MDTDGLAGFGALIADPTRATMLATLLDGRAYTGGELARFAGVSASTASEHLGRLRSARLVTVEAQGRHRYFRLSDPRVAELLELVGSATVGTTGVARAASEPSRPRPAAGLGYARTCYDHLAGELAVRLFDRFVADGLLVEHDDHLELTDAGRELLVGLGADLATPSAHRRPLARGCLDWTERRHHLAGRAGAAVLEALLRRKWVVRGPRPRTIRVTRAGHAEIPREFGVALDP